MLTNDELTEAAQIRARLDRVLTAAISAQGMTQRERNRQRARALISARQDMAALRQRSGEREQAEQARHYRAAFGIRPDRSAEDRAYRDSLAARELTAGDARQLFAQAEARGDEVAMTAIAELAWSNGDDPLGGSAWSEILSAYGATNSQYDEALTAMSEVANPNRIQQFRDKTTLEIQQPPDMRGSLEALAADDEPAAGGSGMQWGNAS